MPRALLLLLVLLASTIPSLSAQDRSRDFGRSADEWCRDFGSYGSRASHCDVREEILTGIDILDVDTGGNGGIRVRGTSSGPIRLRTRIRGQADSEAVARDLVAGVQLSIAGGRVRVNGPTDGAHSSWAADMEIEVPSATPIVLNTRNGGIGIETFSGKADFSTVNGGLRLTQTGGNLRGRTTNGGVRIELDGNRWEGNGLDIVTTNGAVTLVVPDNYSADLDASTKNGRMNVDFPVARQDAVPGRERRITTTLGSGGSPLRISTTNGALNITRH